MITVRNSNRRYAINEAFVKKIARKILKLIGEPPGRDLEVIFLNDASIRAINKRYKKADRPTDVLSFDLSPLGEIFVSLDTALKNSVLYGSRFADEIVLYVTHGILHLCGYDDKKPKDKMRMSRKEEEILEYLCRKENLSKVLTRR